MKLFEKELTHKTITFDPLVIAEISCNHEGSLEQAYKLIELAKECGADAVKIQVYTADEMTLNIKDNSDFVIKDGPWKGKSLYELYTATQTPYEWVPGLFAVADKVKIPIFASVFGEQSLEVLEKNNCEAYKIASFELTHIPLIHRVAKLKKPMILSTGMATINDIESVLFYVSMHNAENYALLHCVSSYPANENSLNLFKIDYYKTRYNCPVGFSDHTDSIRAASVAVGAGACIIEKHLCLLKNNSEDREFSLYPELFKMYIKNIKAAARMLAPSYTSQEKSSEQFRRSIYVTQNIKAGEYFSSENIKVIRPSYGVPGSGYNSILGRKATCDIKLGTALKIEHIE